MPRRGGPGHCPLPAARRRAGCHDARDGPLTRSDPALPGTRRPLTRADAPVEVAESAAVVGDRRWMARALERAREAWTRDEVPVGAVVVVGGRILAEGHNRTLTRSDPTAHAELLAIRQAARRAGSRYLIDATLYVTLEPCAQCAGAIVLARIGRVVYAAPDPKAGMAGSLGNLLQDPRLNHRVEVTPGVLSTEAARLLRDFFRARR